MIEGLIFFLVVVFLIPSLLLTLYALAVYRILSKLKIISRIAIILATAAFLSAITTFMPKLPVEYSSMLGTTLMIILATQIALGMAISITPFERETTEKQRTYMFLSFSVILAVVFLWGFSSVMSTPSHAMDFLHLVDYRSVLKLGRFAFLFFSTFLVFIESAILSLAHFFLCFVVVKILKS